MAGQGSVGLVPVSVLGRGAHIKLAGEGRVQSGS